MLNYIILALALVMIWILAMVVLAPYISKSNHFALLGPALMIKATKNRKILDKVSTVIPRESFSRISVALVMVFSVLAIALLIFEAYLSVFIRVAPTTSVGAYLVLPGINPFIPVFYGGFALIFAVVVHEIMHGVISRKHGIKVRSVGALFFVIPIGAFVEPDQDEIAAADPVIRRRIFAAGPATNLILALIFFIILVGVMMPSVQPIHDGVYVMNVSSPADLAGIAPGSEIISMGNYSGSSLYGIETSSTILPGSVTHYQSFGSGGVHKGTVVAGVSISGLVQGFPAEKSGLATGELFYSINNHVIRNITALTETLDSIHPGTSINVTAINATYSSGAWKTSYHNYTMVTVSKYSYYASYYPIDNSPLFANESFVGVTTNYAGIEYIPIPALTQLIFGDSALHGFPSGIFTTLALPFLGLTPVPSGVYYLYHTPIQTGVFWILTNTVFWLFWLDLLLGITNALPIFILDGGQFFKDTLLIASRRERFKFLNEERIGRISRYMGVLVFVLIMWQLIIPRLL